MFEGEHTEIDIGCVDERAENDTDNDSTSSQRVRLMLNTLCGREAGEQVDDTIIFAVGLGLEVRVEVRLLLIVAMLRGLIVSRLEGILRHTIGDDCFGDHDGRSVEESKESLNWLVREPEELGEQRSIYHVSCNVVQQLGRCCSVVALLGQRPD